MLFKKTNSYNHMHDMWNAIIIKQYYYNFRYVLTDIRIKSERFEKDNNQTFYKPLFNRSQNISKINKYIYW